MQMLCTLFKRILPSWTFCVVLEIKNCFEILSGYACVCMSVCVSVCMCLCVGLGGCVSAGADTHSSFDFVSYRHFIINY